MSDQPTPEPKPLEFLGLPDVSALVERLTAALTERLLERVKRLKIVVTVSVVEEDEGNG